MLLLVSKAAIMSVVGRDGMVSTGNSYATEAGVAVLRGGGNAIDAMFAVQAMLNVVQPQWTGFGGGCFIMVHDRDTDEVVAYDGREEAPAAFHGKIYCANEACMTNPNCDCSKGPISYADRKTGGISIGVPGAPAAMFRALQEHGTMNASQLVASAAHASRAGIPMPAGLYNDIKENVARLALFNASAKLFLNAARTAPIVSIGEPFYNPELAATLELLAVEGPSVLYSEAGVLAAELVATARTAVNPRTGKYGLLSTADLAGYRAVRRKPVWAEFNGTFALASMAPPSSGGVATLLALNALDAARKLEGGPSDVASWARMIDAQNLAFADRNEYLGDADFVDVPIDGLLSPAYAAERAAAIFRTDGRAAPTPIPFGVPPGAEHSGGRYASSRAPEHGTMHYSIVTERHLVAVTTTVQSGMGSGVVLPGRGLLLNDELDDFDALGVDPTTRKPYANGPEGGKKPRRTALDPADAQSLGGKRPRSSMSPVLVFNRTLDGSLTPWMAIGAMGGATIIGSVLHGLINTLAWQMDAQAAIDAPRAYPQNEVDQPLEPALYARFGAQLRALGYNATRGNLLDHYLYIAQVCADGLYRGAADTTRLPESSAMAVSPASVKGDET